MRHRLLLFPAAGLAAVPVGVPVFDNEGAPPQRLEASIQAVVGGAGQGDVLLSDTIIVEHEPDHPAPRPVEAAE